ncbi:hypothetical protein KR067_004050, partial [Drosophila pandora]
MSNLEDIPLAEPQTLPVAPSEITQASKSNSLKRFFKVSKKPLIRDQPDDDSDASSDDNAKEGGKPKTLTRFFTRNKTVQKDVVEATNAMGSPVTEQEKPIPNAKPTIKASISTYWKLLFHRQKNRQDAGSGAQQSNLGAAEQEEVHELQQVQLQESQSHSNTDLKETDGEETSTDPPKTAKMTAEELQDSLEGGMASSGDPATETET